MASFENFTEGGRVAALDKQVGGALWGMAVGGWVTLLMDISEGGGRVLAQGKQVRCEAWRLGEGVTFDCSWSWYLSQSQFTNPTLLFS